MSKPRICILAGSPRPTPPGKEPTGGNAHNRWLKKANIFARYVGALLFPWNGDGDSEVHDWETFAQRMRNELMNPCYLLRYFLKTSRLNYFLNLASNLQVNSTSKRLLAVYRYEFAKEFTPLHLGNFNASQYMHFEDDDQKKNLASAIGIIIARSQLDDLTINNGDIRKRDEYLKNFITDMIFILMMLVLTQ